MPKQNLLTKHSLEVDRRNIVSGKRRCKGRHSVKSGKSVLIKKSCTIRSENTIPNVSEMKELVDKLNSKDPIYPEKKQLFEFNLYTFGLLYAPLQEFKK